MKHSKKFLNVVDELKDKRKHLTVIKREYPEFYNELVRLTHFLPMDSGFKHRLWHVLNNKFTKVLCANCETNEVTWKSNKVGYHKFCSLHCSHSDASTIELRKKNSLEKHGVEWPQLSEDNIGRRKQTCIEKYGTEYALSADNVREKIIQTCKVKYGTTHTATLPSVKQKQLKTIKEKYGVDNSVFADPTIYAKAKETNKRRNGGKKHYQSHITLENLELSNSYEWLYDQHINQKKTLVEIGGLLGMHGSNVCNKMGEQNIQVKRYFCSFQEKQVREFIESIHTESIITNDRTLISPSEIDIVIPDKKLAIEYNGLFWHSELKGIDSKYHLDKTLKCNQVGYKLIHIFENEWLFKTDIVKSRLMYAIDKVPNNINARQCSVRVITPSEKKLFMINNHLQGDATSSVNLGLFHDGEMVSCMTFGKSRFNKKYEYELVRFCNKLFTNVRGGASKLFKHFIKNYDDPSIISYSDKRWGDGGFYLQLGFDLSHVSKPNYFYFKSANKLYSRIQFQKHKLKEKLETVDLSLSEWDNMKMNGFNRIWDCGNDVFVYKG